MPTERGVRVWVLLGVVAVFAQQALTTYPASHRGAGMFWGALSLALLWLVHRTTTLPDAISRVDAEATPDYYLVNCAHPSHVARGLDGDGDDGLLRRVQGLRPNASRMSHAELDEAPELDEGDPTELAEGVERLRTRLPNLRVVGGCCGTDSRHVAALWGVGEPPAVVS